MSDDRHRLHSPHPVRRSANGRPTENLVATRGLWVNRRFPVDDRLWAQSVAVGGSLGPRRLLIVLPENAATKSQRIGRNDREQNETETPVATRTINNLGDVHCVRDAGVAGSNPATPTILSCHSFFRTFSDCWRFPSQPPIPSRSRTQSYVPAAHGARVLPSHHPQKQRVQGMPVASCTRDLVCKDARRKRTIGTKRTCRNGR
jgi:hypothetical protein